MLRGSKPWLAFGDAGKAALFKGHGSSESQGSHTGRYHMNTLKVCGIFETLILPLQYIDFHTLQYQLNRDQSFVFGNGLVPGKTLPSFLPLLLSFDPFQGKLHSFLSLDVLSMPLTQGVAMAALFALKPLFPRYSYGQLLHFIMVSGSNLSSKHPFKLASVTLYQVFAWCL